MALNGLNCAYVPLRNYSLTHPIHIASTRDCKNRVPLCPQTGFSIVGFTEMTYFVSSGTYNVNLVNMLLLFAELCKRNWNNRYLLRRHPRLRGRGRCLPVIRALTLPAAWRRTFRRWKLRWRGCSRNCALLRQSVSDVFFTCRTVCELYAERFCTFPSVLSSGWQKSGRHIPKIL